MTVPSTGRGRVVAGGVTAVALDLDLVYQLFDRGVEDDARIWRRARVVATAAGDCGVGDAVGRIVERVQ